MISPPKSNRKSTDDHPPRARPVSHRRLLGLLVLLAAVVCGAFWVLANRQHVDFVEPPTVDLTSCRPAVAGAISRAVDEVRSTPQSADAWGELGMLLVAHQFELDAMTCFEEAARLDPDEFRWPYLHGVSLLVTDRDAALGKFRRAVELRGDIGVARSRLGELLLDVGAFDEATIHLQEAFRLQPSEVRSYLALARLAFLRDDQEAAVEWAEKAVQIAPDQRATRELLAMIYHRQGLGGFADRELRIAESLPARPLIWNDPVAAEVVKLRNDAAWSLGQAESLIANGQVMQAIGVLDDALRRDRKNPRVPCALARALIQTGQIARAENVLKQALRQHPQTAEVHFQRGVVSFYQEQYEDAATSFQRAVQLKPDYVLAHYNLGHTRERLQNPAAALAAFREAIHYRAANATFHTDAGRILLDQGKAREALPYLRNAVRLDPQNEKARQLLQAASAAAEKADGEAPRASSE